MGIYRRIEKIMLSILTWIWKYFIFIHEIKNIWSKRKLIKQVKLTPKQKRQIDEFYIQNYGKKIPYWWHRLYQSYTGKFDCKYIPEILYSTKLELIANKRINVLPYENKNMLSVLFDRVKNVKIPQTYLMYINGLYIDSNRNVISEKQAIKFLEEFQGGYYQAVMKVTVDTSSGRGVHILDVENGIDKNENKSVKNLILTMGNDFVFQERIKPCSEFKNLYPTAINTLRVITYIVDNKIFVAPLTMRIGQGGGLVDNAHAGGMFIGVSDDGKLLKDAFTEYQNRYSVHPDTNVVFDGYQLPCIDDVKQTAIKLHEQLPMLKFISWDFTINEDYQVVLIEANLHSQAVWMTQIAHGKAFFGENTGSILRIIK